VEHSDLLWRDRIYEKMETLKDLVFDKRVDPAQIDNLPDDWKRLRDLDWPKDVQISYNPNPETVGGYVNFCYVFYNFEVATKGNSNLIEKLYALSKKDFHFISPDAVRIPPNTATLDEVIGDSKEGDYEIREADCSELATNDFFGFRRVPYLTLLYAGIVMLSQIGVLIAIIVFNKRHGLCYDSRNVSMVVVRVFIAYFLSVQIVRAMSQLLSHCVTAALMNVCNVPSADDDDFGQDLDLTDQPMNGPAVASSSCDTLDGKDDEESGGFGRTTSEIIRIRRRRKTQTLVWDAAKAHVKEKVHNGFKDEIIDGLQQVWRERVVWVLTFWWPLVSLYSTHLLGPRIYFCVMGETILVLAMTAATAMITKQQKDVLQSVYNFAGLLLVLELDNLSMKVLQFRPKVLVWKKKLHLDRQATAAISKLYLRTDFMISKLLFVVVLLYLLSPWHYFLWGALGLVSVFSAGAAFNLVPLISAETLRDFSTLVVPVLMFVVISSICKVLLEPRT
jgi:hypothetical protein